MGRVRQSRHNAGFGFDFDLLFHKNFGGQDDLELRSRLVGDFNVFLLDRLKAHGCTGEVVASRNQAGKREGALVIAGLGNTLAGKDAGPGRSKGADGASNRMILLVEDLSF